MRNYFAVHRPGEVSGNGEQESGAGIAVFYLGAEVLVLPAIGLHFLVEAEFRIGTIACPPELRDRFVMLLLVRMGLLMDEAELGDKQNT